MQKIKEVLASEPGSTAQSAIRFGLMNPGVSGVLVGFSKLEHVDEAVAAVDMGPLPERGMRKLDGIYQTDFSGA